MRSLRAALFAGGPWLALGVALLIVAAAARWVDLQPSVDRRFFFASDSPALQDARRIDALFRTQTQLVVIAEAPDIDTERYRQRIERLTDALASLEGVNQVKSITRGPDGLDDARASPLWRRLLLVGDGSASHLVAFVDDPWPSDLIPEVERIVERMEAEDFRLAVAGVPYTVEMMQRRLVRDFRVFSAGAVGLFSLAILLIFRSARILLGTLASCLAAVAATLLLLQVSGAGIGLLTANLTTIVFVLTQSHIVFMTSNWRRLADAAEGTDGLARRAWRRTLQASLWSMLTTALGFATLLGVDAKPLRELGVGGVLGTAAALASAYLLYPPFLAWTRSSPARRASRGDPWARRRPLGAAALLAVAGAGLALGIPRLNTDPGLLSYFSQDGPVYRGLAHLDHNGGSSPLELVVRRQDGARLDDDASYERLWELQRAFEQQPMVGRVVSLPVAMAEADRFPLASLLTWDWKLDLMETRFFDRVAKAFVSEGRRRALFLLQMVEHERQRPRTEVVSHLRELAGEHGFEVPLVGGIFYLQGRLAQQVTASLVQSLAALTVVFLAIAWLAARSVPAALAMTATLALVPAATLGSLGWLGIPLDVVSAPAASVGLGLAADAVLHLVVAARGSGNDLRSAAAWAAGRASQWRGILRSTGVVAAGFGLFALSSFPPTRRFGVAVAFATALAAALALFLLPELGSRLSRLLGRRRS